ncbi:hypothetical protein [Desertibaculum subflavum]|uniref:hypothetical protein n=1 Tax=Desertibaculum subflavum TaxID=2268458 RepID=UPI000E663CCA
MDTNIATLSYFPPAIVESLSKDDVSYVSLFDPGMLRETLRPKAILEFTAIVEDSTLPYSDADRDPAFIGFFEKLDSFGNVETWDKDFERPSDSALTWGRAILQQLERDGFVPSRVAASAEGGIAICFVDGDRYSDLECLNDGTMLGVTTNRRDRPTVWEVEQSSGGIARATARIREFVNAFSTQTNAKTGAAGGSALPIVAPTIS